MTTNKIISSVEEKDYTTTNRHFAFNRKQLCIPYGVFILLFVVFPLFLIIYYAFTSKTGSFSFSNFINFFSSPTSISNLFLSLLIGAITTILCLLIGYPVAYILSRMKAKKGSILLLLFIMPMWINFVLRAMAMKEVLTLFGLFGVNDFANFANTIVGMVYDYLPFMILPLYTTLIKMDKSLEEAALDLGANNVKVFSKVIFPLSLPSVMSGITMVFLPSMSAYVISDTFGNAKISIIGKLIEEQFGTGANWNMGSAIALIMLVVMFITMLLSGGFKEEEGARRTTL